MAELWQFESDGNHYSVRSAGSSVRLYTNRVFHSQWSERNPFAGGIWDCLSLPVLYRPVQQCRRVLLLGLGGGAVVRQLQCLAPFQELIAVELDRHHLSIAVRWFGVEECNTVRLIHDDAVAWLQNYKAAPFNLIIDDLFGHDQGEPVRACDLEIEWLTRLGQHLEPDGLAVINCIDSRQLSSAVAAFDDAGFRSGYRWSLPAYENAIAVLSAERLHSRDWSRHLENSDLSAAAQKQVRKIVRRPIRGLA